MTPLSFLVSCKGGRCSAQAAFLVVSGLTKLPGSPFFNSLKAAVPPLLLAGGILAAYCCPFPSLCQNVSQGQVMTHALEQIWF